MARRRKMEKNTNAKHIPLRDIIADEELEDILADEDDDDNYFEHDEDVEPGEDIEVEIDESLIKKAAQIYIEEIKNSNGDVKKITKHRKNSLYIVPRFPAYTIYETLDGEHFSNQTIANKYNTALRRKMKFEKVFSEKKGNLKRGEEALARIIAKGNEVIDYFWILAKTKETKALKDFVLSQYGKIYEEETSNLKTGEWTFFVIYQTANDKIKIEITNEDTIKRQIVELKSFLPGETISKAKKVAKKSRTSREREAQKGFDKIDLD